MENADDPNQPGELSTAAAIGYILWFGFCCLLLVAGLIIWAWQTYTWLRTDAWPAVTVNGVLSHVSMKVPDTGWERVAWLGDASMAFVLVLCSVALFAATTPMGGKDKSSDNGQNS